MSYAKLKALALSGAAAAGVALLSWGCQSYELDPVTPKAIAVVNAPVKIDGKAAKPYIMLVVDKSGSMKESASGTGSACTGDGDPNSPYDPKSPNGCKWNDLKNAVADPANGFLTTSKDLAFFGLISFPTGDLCDAGSRDVAVSENAGNVDTIRQKIQGQIVPSGGTPTALSLTEALKDPNFAKEDPTTNRKRFIILMTDGVPNCNPVNKAACDRCLKNAGDCATCNPTWPQCDDPYSGASCLDEGGLVSAIKDLHDKHHIDTFVIGFGKDTASGDASRVLNSAADAGGQARQGSTAKYYQANNVADLKNFLASILIKTQTCDFGLDTKPTNPAVMQITLHDTKGGDSADTVLDPSKDWSYNSSANSVSIKGQVCDTLKTAEPNRYSLMFSYPGDL